jgi:hypothetical protein
LPLTPTAQEESHPVEDLLPLRQQEEHVAATEHYEL